MGEPQSGIRHHFIASPHGCRKRALDFIHRGTSQIGYIAYGGEFTLNNGIVDSPAWRHSIDGTNYVGRTSAALDAFEKRKDFYGLSTAFLACKKTYSVLDDFKEKTGRFEDALKQPEWKSEIKLGGRYAQMMTALKKTQSKTALTNLERFAADNPESLYGRWAATVVQKYRDEGVVVDPSTEEPPPAEEKSLPPWGSPAEL